MGTMSPTPAFIPQQGNDNIYRAAALDSEINVLVLYHIHFLDNYTFISLFSHL